MCICSTYSNLLLCMKGIKIILRYNKWIYNNTAKHNYLIIQWLASFSLPGVWLASSDTAALLLSIVQQVNYTAKCSFFYRKSPSSGVRGGGGGGKGAYRIKSSLTLNTVFYQFSPACCCLLIGASVLCVG